MHCIGSLSVVKVFSKITGQKTYSIKDFFSKSRIWSHLLKKSFTENLFFFAVNIWGVKRLTSGKFRYYVILIHYAHITIGLSLKNRPERCCVYGFLMISGEIEVNWFSIRSEIWFCNIRFRYMKNRRVMIPRLISSLQVFRCVFVCKPESL